MTLDDDLHFGVAIRCLSLSVGVQSGGTIQFWKHYFGPSLVYEGIDINFLCLLFENKPSVSITLGDQSNATFWAEYLAGKEPYDIVIDDGGHSMDQQMCASLSTKFPPFIFVLDLSNSAIIGDRRWHSIAFETTEAAAYSMIND